MLVPVAHLEEDAESFPREYSLNDPPDVEKETDLEKGPKRYHTGIF
jgi:hypothetical protein